MEKAISILSEAFSIIEQKGSNPSSILQEILRSKNIDYNRLDENEKIDSLATLFVNFLVNGEASTLANLNFLFEIASELTMDVPVEEFKIIYEEIKTSGTENSIKTSHIDRLYTKYPQKAELYIKLNNEISSTIIDYNCKLRLNELAKNLDPTESDIFIEFKGSHLSLYQNQCQGDVDYYYFECNLIELFPNLYIQTETEIFIIKSVTPECITFRCVNMKKTYHYNNTNFESVTSGRQENIIFPEISFEKKNDKWFAEKEQDIPFLLRSFHTNRTSSVNSDIMKIPKNTEKVLKIKDKIYSLYYT